MNTKERIFSRKIIRNSFDRHFAQWKWRYFQIMNDNLLIESENKSSYCFLKLLQLKHHFYSGRKDRFILSLLCDSYYHSTKSTNQHDHLNPRDKTYEVFEILLRFDNMKAMSRFESVS